MQTDTGAFVVDSFVVATFPATPTMPDLAVLMSGARATTAAVRGIGDVGSELSCAGDSDDYNTKLTRSARKQPHRIATIIVDKLRAFVECRRRCR
jgi:hypothetical protein